MAHTQGSEHTSYPLFFPLTPQARPAESALPLSGRSLRGTCASREEPNDPLRHRRDHSGGSAAEGARLR